MAFDNKRDILIQPYKPDYAELLGTAVIKSNVTGRGGQYNDQDIGKAVKYSTSSNMIMCTSGDEIHGFVMSVEPGTRAGFSVGSVRKEGRVKAIDEVGNLAVGNIVVAGGTGTLGTYALANVKVAATPTTVINKWMVIELYGGGTGDEVLLEKI